MRRWKSGAVQSAVVFLCIWSSRTSAAQSPAGGPRPARQGTDSVPACCTIVRVDSARAIVTARELGTGFTFAFEIRDRRMLRDARVGRPVWADFAAHTVRLRARDRRACCTILPPGAP